jgi:hypothetical protein
MRSNLCLPFVDNSFIVYGILSSYFSCYRNEIYINIQHGWKIKRKYSNPNFTRANECRNFWIVGCYWHLIRNSLLWNQRPTVKARHRIFRPDQTEEFTSSELNLSSISWPPNWYLCIGVPNKSLYEEFIFWYLTQCSLLKINRRFGATCFLHLQRRIACYFMLVSCLAFFRPWRWRRHVTPKRRSTLNGLNGAIFQNIRNLYI